MTDELADVTELPSSPGARLRREREAHGLTTQQAAEQLNLDVMVVEALERNDFAALGAPVFAKGHLRKYAGMLGLPEADLVAAYERSKAQPTEPTLVPKSREEMMPTRGPSKLPVVIGSVVAFLLAAGLAAYVSEHGLKLPDLPFVGDEASETATPAPAEVTPSQVPPHGASAPATGSPPAAVADATTGPPSAPAGSRAATPQVPGQVTLQLKFAAESWIEIYDASGKAVLYDLGQAGTDRSVTATAPLSVTIGNATGVALSINGQAVRIPTMPGQTLARFSVAPDGAVR
jgi:cytoskeleton protein RodZ